MTDPTTTAIAAGRVRIYPDRPAWLRERAGSDGTDVGSSELAVLLGLSPHRSLWSLWTARQAGQAPPDDEAEDCVGPEDGLDGDADLPPEDPRARGQRWECRVGEEYVAYTGRPATPAGEAFGSPGCIVRVRHPVLPWAWASPDFLTVDPDLGVGVVETKTDAGRGWKWGRSGTTLDALDEDAMPPHYHLQAMHLIACLDVAFCDVAVLLGSYRFRWLRVMRNDKEIRQIHRLAAEARERHLVRGEEPDLDDSDACAAHYRARYAGRSDGIRRATEEEAIEIEALAARKAAEQRANAARARLLAAMGELHCLTTGRGPLGEPRGVRRSIRGSLTPFGY